MEALPVFAGSEDREPKERPQDLGEHGEDGRDDIGDGELEHEVVHPRHLVRRRPLKGKERKHYLWQWKQRHSGAVGHNLQKNGEKD